MKAIEFQPSDVLNRKQASQFAKISVYAIDQALIKKTLKSLKFADLQKFVASLTKKK